MNQSQSLKRPFLSLPTRHVSFSSLLDQIRAADKVHWLTLAAISLAAIVLRLWGIRFGLPFIYHFDEHFYVATALKLGGGVLHNPPYAPVGFANILAVEYGIYYVLARLSGEVASAQAFEALYRTDPSSFYLLGRATSAVLGALTVPFVYGVGRLIANRTVGLVAAVFLAASFLHVRDAHYAVPDVAMAFFVVVAVWAAALAGKKRWTWPVYVAGVAAGFAISAKWTAAPVALAVYLATVAIHWPRDEGQSKVGPWLQKTAVIAAIFTLVGFAISSPQIVIRPAPYINEAFGQLGAGSGGGFDLWLVDDVSGWVFYGKQLLISLGIVGMLLGVAGVAYRFWRTARGQDWLLSLTVLAFPLAYYGLMGMTRHYFARYAIPLIPFLTLFAAEMAVLLWRRWREQRQVERRRRQAVLLAFILIVIAQPLLASGRHNVLILREDTRTIAMHWIEENIPADARLATDWETHGPPLATADEPRPGAARVYQYEKIGGVGLAEHSLEWYRERGYDYLIVSSYISRLSMVDEAAGAGREAFYAELEDSLTLVKRFSPAGNGQRLPFVFDEIYGPIVGLWQRQRPGPTLSIYQVGG